MSSLPPELVEPVEQLRAKLVEINTSEQNCMIDIVTSASRGTSIPEVQAVMARCRQAAAAATTAIDAFRSECSVIGGQANSLTRREAAMVPAAIQRPRCAGACTDPFLNLLQSELARLIQENTGGINSRFF
jgi:hypothetical protein